VIWVSLPALAIDIKLAKKIKANAKDIIPFLILPRLRFLRETTSTLLLTSNTKKERRPLSLKLKN